MKKIIIYFLFIILYLLVTFFGLGPVLMADGTNMERLYTLMIVLMFYGIITFALIWLKKIFHE
ncbi:MAG: hypothetical protein CVU84_09805 [Firmicutes bacterium HGW-Firmicutes-1]|nr:MAG: hypothetical protein CVU84_09805 [Firmicutes bacterium HGW-Firmicutes-1]